MKQINIALIQKLQQKKVASYNDYVDIQNRINIYGCTAGGVQDADESFECGYYRALRDVLDWIMDDQPTPSVNHTQKLQMYTILWDNGEMNEWNEQDDNYTLFYTKEAAEEELHSPSFIDSVKYADSKPFFDEYGVLHIEEETYRVVSKTIDISED